MSAPPGHPCQVKAGSYPDRAAAEQALAKFVAITGAFAPRMGTYRCPRCDRFHFGRRPDFARSYGRRR